MTCQDEAVQLYYSGYQAELDNDLDKGEEFYRIAVNQNPNKSNYMQAVARIAQRRGRMQDAKALYGEALGSAKYTFGCRGGMVTSLAHGALGEL